MEKKVEEQEDTLREFKELTNMTPAQLEKWLDGDESKAVGFKSDGKGESVGHQSGRKIIEILRTKKADLTDENYAHMRKVISYLKRHRAQKPSGNIEATPWRYSLMNWGHDPLKKESAGSK